MVSIDKCEIKCILCRGVNMYLLFDCNMCMLLCNLSSGDDLSHFLVGSFYESYWTPWAYQAFKQIDCLARLQDLDTSVVWFNTPKRPTWKWLRSSPDNKLQSNVHTLPSNNPNFGSMGDMNKPKTKIKELSYT